jgi:acyl dehydratase
MAGRHVRSRAGPRLLAGGARRAGGSRTARPIVAGDELVVTTTIESIRSAAGNDMITTRGDIATLEGEHVATAYSLIVSRGADEATS